MSEAVERWRLRCAEWLDLQDAADLLTETKNDVLAEITSKQDGSSHAEKERNARISDDWREFRTKMIETAAAARRARMRMKYEEMQFESWRTSSANDRRELARHSA